MRLIDADVLMEHVYRDRLDSRERIADMVNNAPTIEVRKTGKWIDMGLFEHECSECHKVDIHPDTVKVHYCWNCGAKMGG